MHYQIRQAGPADIPLIISLAQEIWPQTYRHILSSNQIHYMMAWLYNEKMLAGQMHEGYEFLLIYTHEKPSGFAAYSMITPDVCKLHKLYVLHSGHGKGMGRFFIEEVLKRAKANGAATLILNVNRHNKAKGFYEKLGFTVIREEDIDIGNGYYMNDYVMGRSC